MSRPKEAFTVLATGRHVRLVRQDGWECAERLNASGIVVIVPVTPDRKLVLIEQYRPPVGRRVIELPAGLAGDVPGQETEALVEAAHRELLEETGYAADSMRALSVGPPSAGLCTEIITLFLAEGLRKVAPGGGDDSEDIQIHEVPLDQALHFAMNPPPETYVDPKVFAGLFFAGVPFPG